VPHLVEIVDGPPKPAPWAAIPEYTIHPKVETPEEKKASADRAKAAEPSAEVLASAAHESHTATKESSAKRGKAPKATKAAKAKDKAKAAKETGKKKPKAADKPAKAKASKGKK
jgi:hypothetical protein